VTTRRALPLLVAVLACGGEAAETADYDANQIAVEIVTPDSPGPFNGTLLILTLAVDNITLAPAGSMEPNTAHHHLFVNRDIVPEGEVIIAEEGVVHLGAGQAGYTFENLEPGSYTLIAVLGDHAHVRIPGAKTDTVKFEIRGQ